MRDRLPLDKEMTPYSYNIAVGEAMYQFEFHYNSAGDYFTAHLSRDGQVLCYGEKIVYGAPLFAGLAGAGGFPPVRLVPLDESGEASRAGWNEMGTSVFLSVEDD